MGFILSLRGLWQCAKFEVANVAVCKVRLLLDNKLHRTHGAAGAPPPTRDQGLLPRVLAATASMVITPDALLMAATALAQWALPVNDDDLNIMN